MAVRLKDSRPDPFLDRESAIKALQGFVEGTRVTREAMYLLQIINSKIQDGKKIFERIPQSVFGGLPEGGRRNVQAAVLCRAVCGAEPDQQGESLPSGYTKEQEVTGLWAERDGCWSDHTEADQLERGRFHDSLIDGSEATVWFDETEKAVYKNINHIRYPSLSRFLDRIAIHNALFPETRMSVVGFGMHDYADDNTGFCTVVRQALVKGTTPTEKEIERSMTERGISVPEFGGGWFYETPEHDILVTDVHENNCVKTPSGKIIVFDCEAMVNDIEGFGGRYTIPPVLYGEASVREIHNKVVLITPPSAPKHVLLETLSDEGRKEFVRRLQRPGAKAAAVPEGPMQGWLVQQDPEDPEAFILAEPSRVKEFFKIATPRLDDGTAVSPREQSAVLEGNPFTRNGKTYRFDLDKGRVEEYVPMQRKLRLQTKKGNEIKTAM